MLVGVEIKQQFSSSAAAVKSCIGFLDVLCLHQMIPHRRQRAVNGSIGRRRGGRIGIHWAAFWLLTEGCGSQGRTAETRPQLNPSPNRVVGTAGARTGLERVVLIGLKNKDPELRSKTSLYYLMLFSQVFCTLAAMTGFGQYFKQDRKDLVVQQLF